jgi:hypothetical protein
MLEEVNEEQKNVGLCKIHLPFLETDEVGKIL